jgi:hypothetical protein
LALKKPIYDSDCSWFRDNIIGFSSHEISGFFY